MKSLHKFTNEQISKAAQNVRKRALRFTIDLGGCYLGQTCSSAEILAALYMRVLHIGESLGSPEAAEFPGAPGPGRNPDRGGLYNGPATDGYDRFFISPPHYSVAVYSTLAECGRISPDAIEYFNKDGWNMEMIGAEHSPGFENMGGSLGQTISIAAGTAHARKLKGESGRVVTLITDGEMEEGQIWEAVQAAVRYKLDNFVVYVDVNGQQCEGPTKNIMDIELEDFARRFEAFGAVTVVVDGHDIDDLAAAADTPHPGKPLVVVCRTSCTTGIPMLESKRPNLHFISFGGGELEQIEAFYAQM